MSGKDNAESPQSNRKTDAKFTDYVVSEGSIVIFDLHDFLSDKDINNQGISFQSYRQIDNMPAVDLRKANGKILWFIAPYVRGDKANTKLKFELTTKDNKGKPTPTCNVDVVVKRVHRAIIFQGGVSLGAYEAGVFSALVEKLSKEDGGLENEKRPLFDIVAGASIGAMNGAIVVSNVINGKSWEDSAKEVIQFWKDQEYPWPTVADSLDMNPMYHSWLDIVHSTSKAFKHSTNELIELYSNINTSFKKWYDDVLTNWFLADLNFWKDYFIDGWYIPATAESSRRYYSAKQFDTFGAPNVASGLPPWSMFGKFFDLSDHSNLMPRPDNKHLPGFSLKKTLGKFADFPIKTTKEKGEPRFLLVTVDVQTGDAVTFDSYSGKIKYHNEENHISYGRGIEIDHVLASGTFPGFFDYPKFKVENKDIKNSKNELHVFWDGGFRSNTPLREVIQAHRDYWHKTVNDANDERDESEKENDVPDLEVYIADLWPSELKEEPISFDRDFVENRKWGILFGDKTDYDEQVANFVTDYVDLAKQLKSLAQRKGASTDEVNYILDKYASSKNTTGQTRTYKELLGGRFRLTKVVRIDHKDDGHEVGNKIYDYSRTTIEMLMKDGYCDTLSQMELQSMKDAFLKLKSKFVKLDDDKNKTNKDYNDIKKIGLHLQKIQESIKIENSHDAITTTIVNEVDSLVGIAGSMPDELKENKMPIKEEKIFVIDAAKQFLETINRIRDQNLATDVLKP
jgi:NTE family protein